MSDMELQLITIQVFVEADPVECENVMCKTIDYLTESFVNEKITVQTGIVQSGPFTYGRDVVVGAVTFDGGGA